MKCYKVAIETQTFDRDCEFLKNSSKTFLKKNHFSVNYLYSNFSQTFAPYAYFVIDNTDFPKIDGAPKNANIKIVSHYAAYVEPTKNYVKLVFTCKLMKISFINFI